MRTFAVIGFFACVFANNAEAQASRQFDLECVGTQQASLDDPARPHTYGFRIDLDTHRWCWDHCERIYEIQQVYPDRIVFQDEKTDTPRERSTSSNEVSRIDGQHRSITLTVRPWPMFVETKGQCTVAPFSGFPSAMF